MKFCDDHALGYARSRHAFLSGEALPLGRDYRLAHLPLVAPGHPLAIRSAEGRDYVDGRYAASRDALAVHLPAEVLEASDPYRELDREMRASGFAAKIVWDLGLRRRNVLHATIAGPIDAATAERCAAEAARLLKRSGVIGYRIGGPFVGNRNHGRIYLPFYPQVIDGDDAFGMLQAACGRPRTGFYAAGFWHLRDGLDAAEAAELGALVDKWWGREILRVEAARFGILRVHDDLALEGATWRWIDSRICP